MAWEQRGKQRYYYRSRRVGDVVRKEYIGRSAAAVQAAILDANAQENRERDRGQVRTLQDTVQPLRLLAAELEYGERLLMQVAMLSAGYHQYEGTWRKRRGSA
jgi:hypothetical protein